MGVWVVGRGGGGVGESGGVSVLRLRRPRLTVRLRGHSWRTLVLRTPGAGEDTKRVKHQNGLEGHREQAGSKTFL